MFLCSSLNSDFAMRKFDKDSEVYKMIQENKEFRTAPRQSTTFKMLQEVLEADEKGWKRLHIPIKILFSPHNTKLHSSTKRFKNTLCDYLSIFIIGV